MRSVVLLIGLVLSACQTTGPIPHFQALGTEPFWGLEVRPGQLRYSSPDVPDGKEFPATVERKGEVYRFTGLLDGRAVLLVIEPEACGDGMSDIDYPYRASFTWGDRTEQGCARLK